MCPSRVIFDVLSLYELILPQSASLPEDCWKRFLQLEDFFQGKRPSPQSVLHIITLRISYPFCFSSMLHFATEVAVENIQNINLFKQQRSCLIPRSNKQQQMFKKCVLDDSAVSWLNSNGLYYIIY